MADADGGAIGSEPFTFERVENASFSTETALTVSPTSLARVNAALQALPSLVNALPRRGVVRVVLEPGYKLADAGGGLSFGFARGPDGAIAKQARFAPAAKSVAAISTAAFQVVSIVVAQAHLADISARLCSLEDGVAQIRGTQVSELISKLQGSVEDAVFAIAQLQLDEPELRRIERELRDMQRRLRSEVDASIQSLASLRNAATYGVTNHFASIRTKANDASHWLLMLAMCQMVRGKVLEALAMLDPDLPDRISTLLSGDTDVAVLADSIRDEIRNHIGDAEKNPVMSAGRAWQKSSIGKKALFSGISQIFVDPLLSREFQKRVTLNLELKDFSEKIGKPVKQFLDRHVAAQTVLAKVEDGKIMQLFHDPR